jgi:hypothetical protein
MVLCLLSALLLFSLCTLSSSTLAWHVQVINQAHGSVCYGMYALLPRIFSGYQ